MIAFHFVAVGDIWQSAATGWVDRPETNAQAAEGLAKSSLHAGSVAFVNRFGPARGRYAMGEAMVN